MNANGGVSQPSDRFHPDGTKTTRKESETYQYAIDLDRSISYKLSPQLLEKLLSIATLGLWGMKSRQLVVAKDELENGIGNRDLEVSGLGETALVCFGKFEYY